MEFSYKLPKKEKNNDYIQMKTDSICIPLVMDMENFEATSKHQLYSKYTNIYVEPITDIDIWV